MRRALQLLLAAALLVAGAASSSAFNREKASRNVTVNLVGDGSGYLAVAANPSSPHKCFVSTSNGRTLLSFGAIGATCSSQGAGNGVNSGDGATGAQHSRYAFHDLLLVTNEGTKRVVLWVNATTSSGGSSRVDVAMKASSGAMSDSDYATSLATPITLTTGSSAYVGVRVDTGSLGAGSSVFGNLTLEARLS